MRKISIVFLFIFGLNLSAGAVEGMWIPSLIEMFHSDMQTYGLKLSPEQIYSTNQSSLKDGVIQFNGGCTGEIVSNEGLLLTNHHCGLDAIQKNSSPENNILVNGFWAKSKTDEIPCPWLRVTFVREIKDVTKEVMAGITDGMSNMDKAIKIKENIAALEKTFNRKESESAKIKPFNQGNQYYMLITEDYNDIRLVGTPPMAIGKFGGDTDNWVWPRHTGDFSVFRIYANAENGSSKYDEANKPFQPAYSFPISLKPKQTGDFTMVYGFPGQTEQHLTSGQLKFYQNMERPARIDMRQHTLDIIKPAMDADELVYIQYASKSASIANSWKKWIGQIAGLKELNAVEKKMRFEEKYIAKAAERTEWKTKYYNVIDELNKLQEEGGKYEFARSMFIEYVYAGPEILKHAASFADLAFKYEQLVQENKLDEELEKLKKSSRSFFKNYNLDIDKKVFHELSGLYADYVEDELLPLGYKDNWKKMEEEIFSNSMLIDSTTELEMLSGFSKKDLKKLKDDPALNFAIQLSDAYFNKIHSSYNAFITKQNELLQIYVEGMLEMFPDQNWWSDANSTLRIAYGKIEGSAPYDGMEYKHYTTIDGIIQKNLTGNPDFELTDRFFELYNKGDWGGYDQDGELWTCFTASNHTTGGNSGSPVIDAEGNLIGINFDRSWESTMSDFVFDESRCRNIAVDIRYVLWVIDKYGEAPHLIEEMTLIR